MSVDKKTRRNIILLGITTFAVGMSMAMNGALYNNFLKVILNGNHLTIGRVEAIRETPGILSAFMNGAVGHLPEPVVAALSLAVLGLGYAGYYWTNSAASLTGMSFLWSCGFHAWAPLSGSLGVSLASEDKRGELLSKIASCGAVGTFLGYGIIYLAVQMMGDAVGSFYRLMYFGAGVAALIGAVMVWFISRENFTLVKPRLSFRRRYGLYYLLQCLEGCRKQVFITFAAFALVLSYNTGPETMAVLLLLNYVIAFAVAPTFGRLIDYYGERKILSINYMVLILVFLGYAVIHDRWGLYALFCLDNVLFTFSIGLTTYVGRIASAEDLTPTLAMGVSFNHVAAVIVPLVGFWLWKRYGYEVCFTGGAVIVLGQLIAAQWLRTPETTPVPVRPESMELPVEHD